MCFCRRKELLFFCCHFDVMHGNFVLNILIKHFPILVWYAILSHLLRWCNGVLNLKFLWIFLRKVCRSSRSKMFKFYKQHITSTLCSFSTIYHTTPLRGQETTVAEFGYVIRRRRASMSLPHARQFDRFSKIFLSLPGEYRYDTFNRGLACYFTDSFSRKRACVVRLLLKRDILKTLVRHVYST